MFTFPSQKYTEKITSLVPEIIPLGEFSSETYAVKKQLSIWKTLYTPNQTMKFMDINVLCSKYFFYRDFKDLIYFNIEISKSTNLCKIERKLYLSCACCFIGSNPLIYWTISKRQGKWAYIISGSFCTHIKEGYQCFI